jgi:hypothetical protein
VREREGKGRSGVIVVIRELCSGKQTGRTCTCELY